MTPNSSAMAVPPWKTASAILKRVTQLSSLTLAIEISPTPPDRRTFMCLPQRIRFSIYELLLSSSEPIKRPWPTRKFTMQLLRVSKDIFAEASYYFYGKVCPTLTDENDGDNRSLSSLLEHLRLITPALPAQGDNGLDMDAEIDLLASHSGNRNVYMTSPPRAHENSFQPMMNFATNQLDLPPFPYRTLINHISLSPSIPWTPSTRDSLGHYPNLGTLTIIMHSPASIFPYHSAQMKHRAYEIMDQDDRNGHFIRDCAITMNADGIDVVDVVVSLEVLQRPEVLSNWVGAPLEEWYETPDELFEHVEWDVTVDEMHRTRLVHRGW